MLDPQRSRSEDGADRSADGAELVRRMGRVHLRMRVLSAIARVAARKAELTRRQFEKLEVETAEVVSLSEVALLPEPPSSWWRRLWVRLVGES